MTDQPEKPEREVLQKPVDRMDEPFVDFELGGRIESLKQEAPYQRGRNSATLAKYSDFRVVLVVMKAGARMPAHKVAGRISVQTLAGHLQMNVGGKLLDVPSGTLAVLDRAVQHDVEAVGDSAFLLTLANS